jgi:hypothetical protein
MVEEQRDSQQTVTIDQDRMDGLYRNMQASFRNWQSDTSKALDKATDLNKQIYLFYERILLIDTGTVGVSISVLLSTNARLFALGHAKVFVLVTVILGWISLLLSIL